ncbi:MAG: UDP-N-acetylmuramoyl-tripeptide--D-alanyl-D-alanine ligase [Nocardioidaceae bacterium]
MIEMSLAEVAEVTHGRVRDGDPETMVTAAAFVDSRRVIRGGVFVALPGEHVDGHDFAGAAMDGGAVAVLAARRVGRRAVVVEDTVAALGRLTRVVMERLPDLRIVAVTGSQGKTSTKDLMAQILESAGPTVAAQGSFNNEIGVPLTALQATAQTRYLVVEMGSRGPGHISHLCRITPPDVAVVLNVGVAHLGEFGSRDQIALAKAELVEALPGDGTAVLNATDPRVSAMSARTSARVLTFGESQTADVQVRDLVVDGSGRPRFRLVHGGDDRQVSLPLIGAHQAANAAAAAGAALACGLSLEAIAAVLPSVSQRSRWRMEVHERADGVIVINDAYNANPDSMRAALESLVAIGQGRGDGTRTWAVLGEMCELGTASRQEHETLGRLVAAYNVSRLLVVGEEAKPLHLGASQKSGWQGESVLVRDVEQAVRHLSGRLRAGDVVLVKASRAAGLEYVAEQLLADSATAGGVANPEDAPQTEEGAR